jgi:hypothetical protein
MASLEPVIVHIEKPAETLLSEYFVEMRIWLDAHSITPTDFRLIGGPIVGLEVRFSSPEQAALFARKCVGHWIDFKHTAIRIDLEEEAERIS